MADQENGVQSSLTGGDLNSLLCSSDRDFLIRNTGDEVKVDSLKGKKIGLYFTPSLCGPCQWFTPTLAEVYNELLPKSDFEIVFVSADEDDDDEAFKGYFQKMPWLAIPFSDSDTRKRVDKLFKVRRVPHVVILDENGKVLTHSGVEIIREYGVEAYPFTPERMKQIKEQEETARREQSLRSLLVSKSRDYVITADGNKTPVQDLEGKIVGLYFAVLKFLVSVEFTPKLKEVYNNLKEKGENFEIVMIPLDDDEEEIKQLAEGLTWYSLPVNDKSCKKLVRHFELSKKVLALVIIGPDGKTLHPNAAEAVEEHGFLAYPFTPEKIAELEAIDKAKQEAQTLDSILVYGERNFVIGKDGIRIPVSDLVGKTILLYFAAKCCFSCRAFLPTLVEAYEKIKAKHDAFELIFISSDKDQPSFEEYFAQMPWLALPFGDERKQTLSHLFKVRSIPSLVAIGPTGKTITTKAGTLIKCHGADAYPFTDEWLMEMEAQYQEMRQGWWPKRIKHALHEQHGLELTRNMGLLGYTCDGCNKEGKVWSFSCQDCDFDLHPECALENKKETKDNDDTAAEEAENQKAKEGWVCDGDVCHKA